MIVKIMVYLIVFLFLLKLLWNILVPYIAEREYIKWMRIGGIKPSNISLAPIIEILLLIILCPFYYFSNKLIYNRSTFEIFIIGLLLIVASYLIAILVGRILRYFYK